MNELEWLCGGRQAVLRVAAPEAEVVGKSWRETEELKPRTPKALLARLPPSGRSNVPGQGHVTLHSGRRASSATLRRATPFARADGGDHRDHQQAAVGAAERQRGESFLAPSGFGLPPTPRFRGPFQGRHARTRALHGPSRGTLTYPDTAQPRASAPGRLIQRIMNNHPPGYQEVIFPERLVSG